MATDGIEDELSRRFLVCGGWMQGMGSGLNGERVIAEVRVGGYAVKGAG